MIVVMSTLGTEDRYDRGTSWDVNRKGHLLVHDIGGELVAVYATGRWDSARNEPQPVADEAAE